VHVYTVRRIGLNKRKCDRLSKQQLGIFIILVPQHRLRGVDRPTVWNSITATDSKKTRNILSVRLHHSNCYFANKNWAAEVCLANYRPTAGYAAQRNCS